MNKFVSDVIAGKGPDAVIFLGVNPVYTLANGKQFGEALGKIGTSVSLASHSDETASLCKFICPDHHALESWNDFNPTTSHYSLAQPTIRPLFNTASALESMLVWAGKVNRGGKDSKVSHDYIMKTWETTAFPAQTKYLDLHTFWNMAIHNSCIDMTVPASEIAMAFNEAAFSRSCRTTS